MPSRFESPAARREPLLAAQVVVAGLLERQVEARVVVAGVDRQPRRDRSRELADEVQPANLGRVLAELPCERVDRPLDRVRRLRAARAAIRIGRHRVREDTGALEAVTLDVVAAPVQPGAEQRDPGRDELEVRTHPADEPGADRGDLPLRGRRQFDLLVLVAAVDRRDVSLAPRLGPLHRPPEPARDRERERLLGVDVELRAVAAADVGRDHAQLRLGDAGDAAQRHACDVRHLRRRPERELARSPGSA